MYRDLEVKATLDADETVRLLEALIAVSPAGNRTG
jgi:hypothetical protein